MLTENSIKENLVSTTIQPITDTDEIIKIICEWDGITLGQFKDKVGSYYLFGKDNEWKNIYTNDFSQIVNPIGMYLRNVYNGKTVVFEKWNDKFFWKIKVSSANNLRYMLNDKVIEIPFKIWVENEDTHDGMTIFPKTSDFIQPRMKSLYVVNTWWAERQRLEKEIMAKLIELAKVRGWNEIISTQNIVEELKQSLQKKWIDLDLWDKAIRLGFPRRKLRDVANHDGEYIAPPIEVEIDFESKIVQCRWYSPHWFGTPNSWWSPCWWNWDREITACLRDCDLRGLVNLIISWAWGYNSQDTGTSHSGGRHPICKLKDYMRWARDNRSELSDKAKQWIKDNLASIKADLSIDDYLDECNELKEFLATFEDNNETPSEW